MVNWLRCLVVATEDYAEYFCDALGTIRDIIEPRGATIVGHWPTAGYHFEASKVWLMMTTLSVWLSTKIVSRN